MLRSVRSRVIALAVGVATVAILMTAWLTTLSAEQAIRDQATASLQVDATIYDRLSQYGGENRTWDYAAPLVKLTDEVETLSARVDEHLKKMGASWK